MRRRSAIAEIAILGGILAFSSLAHAASPEADALIDHGVELREQSKDDLALEEFKKAYAIEASARALAQIGLAEQALGLWRDAERDVSKAEEAANDPWIEKNRPALDGALVTIRGHLGSLEVRTDAPNAELFVDGASLGPVEADATFRVEAGTRNVEVRAQGKYSSSRSVIVPAGGVARETIELQALPTTPPPDQNAGRGRRTSDDTKHPISNEHAGDTQRNIGWAFLGTAGALAVTGVVGIVARNVEIGSYDDDGSCPGLHSLDQPPICQSKITTAQTWT
ncbi:MAG: hypothetical protein ACRELY_06130, partial [Polyangiaceae bacterium]